MPHSSSTLAPPPSRTTTGETENLLRQAIGGGLCVRIIHRRQMLLVGPHILYECDGTLWLEGLVIDGDEDMGAKEGLGAFKLSAIKSVALTTEPFAIHRSFDAAAARYVGPVLAAIEA